ncbi:hypothetical protein [Phenylobacterium sp.]|uniref:hypothetical protein n=1 Tax=Phenylobacterium sp. TaxID=1871053 RepID=UPI002FE1039C
MKNILLSVAAAAALATAAAPAAAQSWDRGHDRAYAGARHTSGEVDGLEWKINNAAREGRISRGEARELMGELRAVQPLAWRVETGQASRWERQRLDQAVNRIERAVNTYRRADRYDRDGREYGYGYGRRR